jgi:hypothetical protein
MPGEATIRLRKPHGGIKLSIEGFFPAEYLRQTSRHLTVRARAAGGERVFVGETQISDPESTFRRLFDLPASLNLTDGREVEVEIRVDPVTRISGQEYGAVFGQLALVP